MQGAFDKVPGKPTGGEESIKTLHWFRYTEIDSCQGRWNPGFGRPPHLALSPHCVLFMEPLFTPPINPRRLLFSRDAQTPVRLLHPTAGLASPLGYQMGI